MMNEECNGELEPIFIKKGEEKRITLKSNEKYQNRAQAIYCVFGEVKINISNNEILNLRKGDAVLLTVSNLDQLDFIVYNDISDVSRLVKATIIY